MIDQHRMAAAPRTRRILLILLSILTLVAYARLPANEFVNFDDNVYITENPNVSSGLTTRGVAWAFISTAQSNWHPLTWLSHQADVSLFGLSPAGHHLMNLSLHLASALLLLLALAGLTGDLWKSALVASLFAVHPLHVESVAWAAERKDVLSTLFWMLTVLAYLRYLRGPSLVRYLPVVLAYAAGLLSKPMLVTIPLVLLLLDYWPLARFRGHRFPGLILEKLPLFLLAAVSSVVTYQAQISGGSTGSFEHFPPAVRLGNALVAAATYLLKMLWPSGLAVFYPHLGAALPRGQILASGLALGAVTIASVVVSRRKPCLAAGWFWYLITLVPVIGLVQVGSQSLADRYTYVPLIGIFLAAAWGIPAPISGLPRGRTMLAALSVGVLLVMTGLSFIQVGYWRNSLALMSHALEVTDLNWKAHALLGNHFRALGRLAEAEQHYREALRILPALAGAHTNLGVIYLKQRRYPEAVQEFRQVRLAEPKSAQATFNLAYALEGTNDLAGAERLYREAILLDPAGTDARNNLGNVLRMLGRFEEAATQFREAIALNPRHPGYHYNLGDALLLAGRPQESLASYRLALELNPAYADAANNLGVALLRLGRTEEAAAAFRQALTLKPDFEKARVSLERILSSKPSQ